MSVKPWDLLNPNEPRSEEELKELNFPKLGIMRPSFLIGNRKEKRASETIGIFVFKLLSPLLLGPLKKMKPIHSEIVAKAMIRVANENLEKNSMDFYASVRSLYLQDRQLKIANSNAITETQNDSDWEEIEAQ